MRKAFLAPAIQALIDEALENALPFRATVISSSGGDVVIRRIGATVTESYKKLATYTAVNGDSVIVANLAGGGCIVLGKIG